MLVRDGVIVATGPSEGDRRQLPTMRRSSMRGDAWSCRDSSTRTRIRCLAGNRVDEFEMRARGATYEEIAAAGAEFARPSARRGRRPKTSCWRKRKRAQMVSSLRNDDDRSEVRLRLLGRRRAEDLRVVRRLNEKRRLNLFRRFLGAHAIPEEFPARARALRRRSSSTRCCRRRGGTAGGILRRFLRARLFRYRDSRKNSDRGAGARSAAFECMSTS